MQRHPQYLCYDRNSGNLHPFSTLASLPSLERMGFNQVFPSALLNEGVTTRHGSINLWAISLDSKEVFIIKNFPLKCTLWLRASEGENDLSRPIEDPRGQTERERLLDQRWHVPRASFLYFTFSGWYTLTSQHLSPSYSGHVYGDMLPQPLPREDNLGEVFCGQLHTCQQWPSSSWF